MSAREVCGGCGRDVNSRGGCVCPPALPVPQDADGLSTVLQMAEVDELQRLRQQTGIDAFDDLLAFIERILADRLAAQAATREQAMRAALAEQQEGIAAALVSEADRIRYGRTTAPEVARSYSGEDR